MSVGLDDTAQGCSATCSIEVTVTIGLVLVREFTAKLGDQANVNAVDGVARFEKLKCNVEYTVTVTLTNAQLARCAANPVLTMTKNVTANDGKFLFVLEPVTALTVTVARQDRGMLLGDVQVDVITNLGQAAVPPATLRLNATTHTFRDIAPGEYSIGVTAQHLVEAEFRIGRTIARRDAGGMQTADNGREEKVNVPAQQETIVSFVLAPQYTHVQFIGYYIYTGGNYRGSDDPANFASIAAAALDDVTQRCTIMQSAIAAARANAAIDQRAETLKVFMAPEFYFRGLMGGYPLDTIPGILERLQTETLQEAYKDWLFVFGTAVGYREFLDQYLVTGLTIEEVAILFNCSSSVDVESWSLVIESQNGAAQTVVDKQSVTVLDTTHETQQVLCEVNADFSLPDGAALVLVNNAQRKNATGLSKLATLTFTCKTAPKKKWQIRQNGVAGLIQDVVQSEDDEHTCTVRIPNDKSVVQGNAILARPAADTENEIFNIALIQKGGPTVPASATGGKAIKEALVYKEHVSPIDFEQTGGDKVALHGSDQIKVVPTEGAIDSKSPNDPTDNNVSEVNKSGLGGGSILTIDDVDFGIEVCLDHQQQRLLSYYNGNAKAGEPMIQVHLIPSAGATILNSPCVSNGWIFNVDNMHCVLKKNVGPNQRALQLPAVCAALQAPNGLLTSTFFNGGLFVNPTVANPSVDDFIDVNDGYIVVYDRQPLPAPATVA